MWIRFQIFAATVLAVLSLGSIGRAAPDDEPSFSCGLNATYIFLNRTGHHASYDDLRRDFQAQTPPDSLLAIRNVLAEHGCSTLGVKVEPGYFLEHTGPAIVYLQLASSGRKLESHFSCMVGADRQTGAEFRDPLFSLQEPAYMTWDIFTQSFKGDALILK